MPKCLYCNETLEFDNTWDETQDGDFITQYVSGHCPICETEYEWREHYSYTHFTNLKEIEEE